MFKGVYTFEIEQEGQPAISKVQENLILNAGLRSIINAPAWSTVFLPTVRIGSDPLDPHPDQVDVQQLLGIKHPQDSGSGLSYQYSVGPDIDEYIKMSFVFQAKEWEYNGKWAEMSIPGLSRIVLCEPGELELGTHRYAMTSRNNVGESVMTDVVELEVTDLGSSVRLEFQAAPNQTVNTRTPSEYILYKETGGVFKRVATVLASQTNRFYFYDRGDFIPLVGNFNPGNTLLAPPSNFTGAITLKPTQKPIIKNNLMKINVKVDIYVGNKDLIIP